MYFFVIILQLILNVFAYLIINIFESLYTCMWDKDDFKLRIFGVIRKLELF